MKNRLVKIFLAISFFLFTAQSPFAQDFQLNSSDNPVVLIRTNLGQFYAELFQKEAPKTVGNFIGLAEGTRRFKDSKTQKWVKKNFYDNLIFHRVIKKFMIQGGDPLGNGTGNPGYKFEDEINADALGLQKIKVLDEKGNSHPWLQVRSQNDFNRVLIFPLLRQMQIKTQSDMKKQMREIRNRLNTMSLKDVYRNQGYRYNSKFRSYHPKRGTLAMANSGPNTNGSQFFINLVDTNWLIGKHTVFGKVVKGMGVVDRIGKVPVDSRSSKPKQDIKILSIRLHKEQR